MNITLKKIAKWTAGTVAPEYEDIEVTGFVTDSRKVKPGEMFVPLKGERFDGHNFISGVVGKCAAVLSGQDVKEDIPVVRVKDTLLAYGDIARGYRKTLKTKIVGVTGSVGKTSTKEMIACVLESVFRTAKTEGNHNNNIGLPETLLSIPADAETAVVEMGMNHFKEMSYLSRTALPDIAVITNIGTAHIENLGSKEGILKAKLEILDGLREDGIVVLNGDDPYLWGMKGKLPFRTVYYGIQNDQVELLASNVVPMEGGTSFHVVYDNVSGFEIYIPTPGKHNVYNALAATAVGLLLDVTPQKIQKSLMNYQNTGMRQNIYDKNGYTIIEDCYNAGPESMAASLSVLKELSCSGRKIAVLGDMLELGNVSLAEHYRIGRIAATCVDYLFTYGTHSVRTCSGAITGGMQQNAVFHFDDHAQLARVLKNRAKPGDVLLFKGSRGMRMEHVLALFLEDGGNDK